MKTFYLALAFLLMASLTGLAVATAMLPDRPIGPMPARSVEVPETFPAAW